MFFYNPSFLENINVCHGAALDMLYPKSGITLKLHEVIWDLLVKSATFTKQKRHQLKKKTNFTFPVDVKLLFFCFLASQRSGRKAMRDVFVLFSL